MSDEPIVPESLQAYVNERLPGATVQRRRSELDLGSEEFSLGLRLGARGIVDEMLVYTPAANETVRRMVRSLEALGMETFKVAIAERTAHLEHRMARALSRADRAERDLAEARQTIRALVKDTP